MFENVGRFICSNIAHHDEGLLRGPAFAVSALYGARVPATYITRRFGRALKKQPHKMIDTALTMRALCKFMGDNFNTYIGTFTPERMAAKKISLGTKPSPIVQEALDHPDKKIRGGIKPGTLKKAARLGIISQKTFFAFANLSAWVAREEQLLALDLKAEHDQTKRSKIREDMVSANNDFLIVAVCMTAHILNPNPEIKAAEKITMEMLRRIYPEQARICAGFTLTYGNIACVNRMFLEEDERIEPDPIIAILESRGQYTEQLVKQVKAIVESHLPRKTIPIRELPDELQTAIRENQDRILNGIKGLDNPIQRILAKSLAQAHIYGGSSLRVARARVDKSKRPRRSLLKL